MSPEFDDVDLLQHLPHDHFDVLVVDVDALQPVDFLDLVDEIGGQFLDALDRQNVVRRRIAVDDVIALLDNVAILQMDVLALRDQIFDRIGALFARNDAEALLVLVIAAELHRAGDLRDDRVILGTARLEQFRDARQTAGDVARLGALERNTRDDVAGLDLRAPGSAARIESTGSEITRVAAALQLADLAVLAP